MKLSEVKRALKKLETIGFQLPNGALIPPHFHVTEVGKINKQFIDCGGTIRNETKVNFQLWDSVDYDHRLHPEKLLNIIKFSEEILNIKDFEIEVEYQADTIGKFGLDFDGKYFVLTTQQTDCLAKDYCEIPEEKPKARLSDLNAETYCSADGNCC